MPANRAHAELAKPGDALRRRQPGYTDRSRAARVLSDPTTGQPPRRRFASWSSGTGRWSSAFAAAWFAISTKPRMRSRRHSSCWYARRRRSSAGTRSVRGSMAWRPRSLDGQARLIDRQRRSSRCRETFPAANFQSDLSLPNIVSTKKSHGCLTRSAPLVLCCLQGLSYDLAAQQLG